MTTSLAQDAIPHGRLVRICGALAASAGGIALLGWSFGLPFLASLGSDRDSDVRAAAAWALSATETSGNLGEPLLGLLRGESDADVRLRLYQALGNQESFDATAALNIIRNEKDPSARVVGLDLLAKTLAGNPTSPLRSYFDQTALPELTQTALSGQNSDDRMAAVVALTRASTFSAAAVDALRTLAQQASDPRVLRSVQSYLAKLPPQPPPP